jgi:hypothetical protein
MSYQDKLKPVATSTPSYKAKLKPVAPSSQANAPGLGQTLAGRYKEAAGGALDEAKKVATGKTDMLTGAGRFILRPAGAAGRAVGDIVGAGISAALPDDIEKKIGETVAPVVKPAMEAFGKFKQARPEIAQDIEDVVGATELLGGGLATKPIKVPIKAAIKTGVDTAKKEALEGASAEAAKSVSELLTKNRNILKSVRNTADRGVDLQGILQEPSVYQGLKVKNGTILPDDAITTIDNRIDTMMDAKRTLLPVMDRELPKVSREEIRRRALANIEGKDSPLDESEIAQSINAQVDALPEQMTYSQLDDFRARFRSSSRNAKGIQKRSSEYAALENATRDLGFEGADRLPPALRTDFGGLNDDIKQHIATRDFLDVTLRGQKVKYGRVGTITGRVLGSIAGSGAGVFGTLVGQEAGATIARILTNNTLGSSIKMKLIGEITDNPRVLQQARELLEKAGVYEQPKLGPGGSGAPIPLPSAGESNLRTTFPKGL